MARQFGCVQFVQKKQIELFFLDGADFRMNFIYVLYKNVFVKIMVP